MKKFLITVFTIILFSVSLSAQSEASTQNPTKPATKETKVREKAFRPTKTQITQTQEKLKAAGTYAGETDGKYNDDFRASLKKYQEGNNLEQNGKLDEATLAKMNIELTDNQKGIETKTDSSKPTRVVFRVSKEQIMEAQKMLKTNGGSFKGAEDGAYSKEFRASIRDYQAANGLKKSGSLNRATLEKMNIGLTEAQTAIPVNPDDLASADGGDSKKRDPVFRATKEQVTTVQQKLKAANLYNGEQDGKFSDDFRSAIKEWQKANSVKETGTLNKETLEAMKIELTDKQKEM